MDATRCLRDEHQVILKVLDCFDLALQQARAGGTASREVFEPFLEFFRGFADKCHHCKEEDRLFPCMEARGIPREGGPIGVMLLEHQQGRQRVRAMADELDSADGGDAVSIERVLDQGQAFLELLRGHINKEDNILFNMADQLIQGGDLTQLTEGYETAENEAGYQSTFGNCRDIADRLMEKYGVSG
ncbi:MAG: hemerythrin domain-containing protein [Planctomycetota bacterium]